MSSVAGNTSTTQTLSPGEVETRTIDTTTDADWFRVNLTSGLTYGFTVAGFGGPSLGMPDPDLFLYNSAGTQIAGDPNGSSSSISFSFSPMTTTHFFIGVSDLVFGDTGGYRLTWVATDTLLNNTNTTRTLGAGQTIASKIDVSQDSDWVKVTLTEGLSYAFQLEAGGGADQLEDGDLFVYDENGNVAFRSPNSSSTTNYLSALIQNGGTYYVEVSDNGFSDTGSYNLNWVATDTIVNTTATARTLARNTATTSRIDVTQDEDWFRVTMTKGLSYGFQVASNGANGLPDGDVFLLNASGNVIQRATNGSTSTNTLGHTASASGTYYIAVSDNGFNDIGAYILRNLGLDTDFNNTGTDLALREGGRMAGRIDVQGDSDWVKFRGEQGITYTFKLEGDGSSDELADVRLTLRDANGSQLNVTSGPTGLLTFTATTDSFLYLDVQGQSFDDTGDFRLSVISTAPTVNGTASSEKLNGGSGNTVMNGYAGNDTLDGGTGNDRLIGALGNDYLIGGDGNDRLTGDAGNDVLSGGAAADTIAGGGGNDVLRGGLGADRFVFATGGGTDIVRDFQNGADRIEITSGAGSTSALSIRQIGDDVRISFGTTVITLENIDRDVITAADFLFT